MSEEQTIEKWKNDRRELGNTLYAAVCEKLTPYEERGFNSHSRTQIIVEELLVKSDEWIEKNLQHKHVRIEMEKENNESII